MERQEYRVAGYVKLAKWWETSRDKAIPYHMEYYEKKCAAIKEFRLMGVYVEITGQKEIRKRPEMIRLLNDCALGKVNLIAVQTKAYLAANIEELCYLLKFLSDMPLRVDIISEDEDCQINTVVNPDHQREAFLDMTEKFIRLNPCAYDTWKSRLIKEIDKQSTGE